MKDPISLKRIETLHPLLRDEMHEIFCEIDSVLTGRAICRLSHTLRTFAEQDKLFAQRPKVTNARGGQSYHNYGLAVDIVLLKDTDKNGTFESASWETNVDFDGDGKADWMECVAVFEKHGWEWGGRWKSFPDRPHFQKTFGKSIAQLQQLHKAGKTDKAGYVTL